MILKKMSNGIEGSNLWAAQQSLICGIIPRAERESSLCSISYINYNPICIIWYF